MWKFLFSNLYSSFVERRNLLFFLSLTSKITKLSFQLYSRLPTWNLGDNKFSWFSKNCQEKRKFNVAKNFYNKEIQVVWINFVLAGAKTWQGLVHVVLTPNEHVYVSPRTIPKQVQAPIRAISLRELQCKINFLKWDAKSNFLIAKPVLGISEERYHNI